MTALSELDAKAMGGEWLPDVIQDYPTILEHVDIRFACELVNRYRTGQLVERQEGVVVPVEPTEEMWAGLARDIIFWHDTRSQNEPPTPRSLFDFLGKIGTEIPQWLRDEPELQNIDHAISKGTRAVIIYRAMLAAAQGRKG